MVSCRFLVSTSAIQIRLRTFHHLEFCSFLIIYSFLSRHAFTVQILYLFFGSVLHNSLGHSMNVTVKTLAIRSTAEEVMMTRRAEAKARTGLTSSMGPDSSSGQKLPSLIDDFRIRSFIEVST